MEKSFVFNSINKDRVYKAEDFASYFASFIGNGIFPNPSNQLQVLDNNNNMYIIVKEGKSWINGYYYQNTNDFVLKIDPADSVLNRIDRIVLRLDFNTRSINLKIKKGEFASNAVAKTLQRDADAHELALADIYIRAGAIKIKQADITDLRLNKELCGIVHGTVDQVDTTTIFNQYLAWYKQITGQAEIDIDTIKEKFEADFNIWFQNIKNILDENTAGNLLDLINKNSNSIGNVGTKEVDETNLKDNYTLRYDAKKDKIVYVENKIDRIPPAPVTNFKATSGNAQVILLWINPIDSDFAGVKILRKTGNYPTSITDGTVIYTGANTSYTDTNLTNNTIYYYRIFTYDINGNFNTITSGQQVATTPTGFKEYGVRWTKSTDTMERLGNSIGLIAITGGQNDFSSLLPWRGMKRCNLSDSGVVNAYYGSPAYKVDGSNGQVMVEVPKFWFKINCISDDVIEFWICDGAKSGYEVHPAFFRDRLHLCDDNSGTAIEVDYRYISAYESTEHTGSAYQGGNGYNSASPSYNSSYKLSSVSGFYPIANRNMSEFRTLAKNRGNGWGQQDYYLTYAIQLLYLVEYAHFNSQTKIGNGNSNSSAIFKTGTTNSYGNNSYGTASNTTTAMSYRGIENLYGNVWKWIDGLYSDSNRKVFFANKGFTDNCTNYNNSYATGLSSNLSGYISDIWGDKTMGFIPKATSGSATTKLCDSGGLYDNKVVTFGGSCGHVDLCGCFHMEASFSPTHSDWGYSARIAF